MRLLHLLRYVLTHPLNASGRIRAVGRVIRWQIGSRLLPGFVALPYVGSTQLLVSRGMTGATGNWYCGLHEVCEMAFVLHVLRATDHFVDVGANVGSYTVLAAGAVGARTTAIEPIPTTFAHLVRNVALNGLGEREFELGSAARVGSYDQASAGAAGSLIGGFSLIVASDSRLM